MQRWPEGSGAALLCSTQRTLKGVVAVLAAWLALMTAALLPVEAMARDPEVQQLDVQRTSEGGLEASVRLGLQAPNAVRDALERGVPLYFVWQADIYRPRWYWWDKRIAGSQRAYRLLYQPLTRRWRLSISSNAGGEQQTGAALVYALHQTYDTLPAALASIGRVTRWELAESGQLAGDEEYRVVLSFRLDLALLPRPLQLGVADENGWKMEWRREMVLGVWMAPAVGQGDATDAALTALTRTPGSADTRRSADPTLVR